MQYNYTLILNGDGSDPFIDNEFRNEIVLHVAKNMLNIPNYSAPLYLGIQGPKGVGKSYQVVESCIKAGFAVVLISATELSGQLEGESKEKFLNVYKYAAKVVSTVKRHTVLVIDDFHLGVASMYDGITHTVNSQLLTGVMMNIHDNHKLSGADHRVPVILIGNDFTGVHSPLTRNGRMKIFTYEPSQVELISMLDRLLINSEIHDLGIAEKLVLRFKFQNISFFKSAISLCYESLILEAIKKYSVVDSTLLSEYVLKHRSRINFEYLLGVCKDQLSNNTKKFEEFK